MLIVTSYDSPDLDGIACSIAYSELLNKLNIKSIATYSGNLGLEVDFVKKYSEFFPISHHVGEYDFDSKFILVDTADPDAIESTIPANKVIEIFDHRQLVYIEKFINAKSHIESVGSCATLIAEEFIKNKVDPSKGSAIYLHSAIISNTINFKNSVTTVRDIDCANWLQTFSKIDNNFAYDMFKSKSNVNGQNIYSILAQDFAIKEITNKKIGISQIEMVDIDRMNSDLHDALIESLTRLKSENNLDFIFFTGIDVFKGFNIFYTVDNDSSILFSKATNIPNLFPGYKTSSIIMRKQIWPKVEAVLNASGI